MNAHTRTLRHSLSALLLGALLQGACGAPVADGAPGDPEADVAEAQAALQGNGCFTGPTLPTWCRADLVVNTAYALVYEPGNPQNYAPGYYITFGIKNTGLLSAGPSTAEIRDQAGVLLKTVPVPALAPGAGASASIVAPYPCGWKRTLTLDTTHAVAEANEGNNTWVYNHSCP